MPHLIQDVLDTWTLAKRIADKVVLSAERGFSEFQESESSESPIDNTSDRSSKLVETALACVRALAAAGDARAQAILGALLLSFPEYATEHADLSDQRPKAIRSRVLYDVKKATFDALGQKLQLARDVVNTCFMDPDRPDWGIGRPKQGQLALFVLCEHRSAILAQTHAHSLFWHATEIVAIRRTWCSARLLKRLDRPSESERIAVGQIIDYSMEGIAVLENGPAAR